MQCLTFDLLVLYKPYVFVPKGRPVLHFHFYVFLVQIILKWIRKADKNKILMLNSAVCTLAGCCVKFATSFLHLDVTLALCLDFEAAIR